MKKEYNLRHPVVSGLFYPDDENELKQTIEEYLSKVDRRSLINEIGRQTGIPDPEKELPLVLVSPHAGYIFSGEVQAYGFSLLAGKTVDAAVIVGPAHQASFEGLSVSLDDAYEIPLGIVEVELDLAKNLVSFDSSFKVREEAHLAEHSVEVQLPFVKAVLPRAKIVPVLMGEQSLETAVILKDALVQLLKAYNGKCVIIASSDLSHYHSRIEALELDQALIQSLKQMDAEALFADIKSGSSEACGFGGILAGILLSKELGKGKSAILAYRDSGEISGDRRRVVGYLSAVMY